MKSIIHLNIRLIVRIIGLMLLVNGGLMLIPLCYSFLNQEPEAGVAFAISFAICILLGAVLNFVIGRSAKPVMRKKEGFLIVGLIWIIIPLFGALPFMLSNSLPHICDAFFESMSGFTSTGSTIFHNIEGEYRGILLWRSLSQWLGGGGLILFTIILLRFIKEDLQHLYIAEITGPIKDKLHPKIVQISRQFWGVYLSMTVLLFIGLLFGEMKVFDAACHAMSTISTGGFSTFNSGLNNASHYTQNLIAVFMFFSGINFALLYLCFTGKPMKLIKDEQFKWYCRIIAVPIIVVFSGLAFYFKSSVSDALQESVFTVVSIASTTGYNVHENMPWGTFIPLSLFFLMLIGGCAGSTAGGIKITRVTLLLKYVFSKFRTQLHSRAIVPIKNNGEIVLPGVLNQIFAFFFLYILFLMAGGFLLTFSGHTIPEALSLSAASLGNIGPVVKSLCPTCDYTGLSIISKWTLSFLMLAGRLEIFALVALFSPSFWKS